MGKYRSAAFKGSLDKEVAQEIADFIGAVTEQEAIVIVSCPNGRFHTHILAANEPVSAEDKAEINKWVKKRAELYIGQEGKKVEDKKKICEMLLPVLQETRGFKDLISLKYEQEGSNEIVVATYYNGYQKVANVTADSEAAMIIDVIKQCM